MYRFIVAASVCVVAALVAVLAVSSSGPAADVVIVNGAYVHDLDPAKMSWMHDIRTAYGLWEGLLSQDPATGEVIPALAERHAVSDDGRTWTFHLRRDGRWSNGDPVTAGDFAFAWFRVLDPATAADYYNYMLLIDGAAAYYKALGEYEEWLAAHDWPTDEAAAAIPGAPPRPARDAVGIRVVDEWTLEVRLARPVAYFPELIAFATFLPVHEKSMARFLRREPGRPPYYDGRWLKPANLVCNGPFTLERWDFQYRLLLKRNEHYWDRAHVPSRRIELLANPDANTAFQAYESGAADLITTLPEVIAPVLLRQTAEGRRSDLHVFPVHGTYYYRFNCKRPPLDDPRVRKALAACVDREQIVRRITGRGERAQTSFVTPGLFVTAPGGERIEYRPAAGVAYDPALGRRLLAEAGYGADRPLPEIRLLMNDSELHKAIGEAVVKMWADQLGITVRLDQQVSNTARQRMSEHDFDLCRSGWFTDYADPTGYLEMFRTGDGNNDGQFDVAAYNDLLDKAADELDPARRYELIGQAERILVADQVGVIPIYQYVGQFLYRRDLLGVGENSKQQIMLKDVEKRQ